MLHFTSFDETDTSYVHTGDEFNPVGRITLYADRRNYYIKGKSVSGAFFEVEGIITWKEAKKKFYHKYRERRK